MTEMDDRNLEQVSGGSISHRSILYRTAAEVCAQCKADNPLNCNGGNADALTQYFLSHSSTDFPFTSCPYYGAK